MTGWPDGRTDLELVIWAVLSRETTDSQKARARAELVRRFGSSETVAIIRERLALPTPLGLLPGWVPQALRGSPEEEIWEARTASGSVYRFVRTPDGRWWLEADRKHPSPTVFEWSGRTPIGRPHPFPPQLGSALMIPLIDFRKLRFTSEVVDFSGPSSDELDDPG